MSLRPRPWPEPADEITNAVLAMYARRRAPLPVVVRDELGELFADSEFAAAFGTRGTVGWSPGRLAMVTVLQPRQDRSTALFALATELPAAMLARMLSVNIKVALQWQQAAAGDWTAYAADVSQRTDDDLPPRAIPAAREDSAD